MGTPRGSALTVEEVAGRAVDDATAAELADLETSARPTALAGDPPVVGAEVAENHRLAPAHEDHRLWLTRERPGGRLLGASLLEVEDVTHNRRLAYVEVQVRPECRRRG
ncbi:MAG: hypothetical protein M3R01_03510, partial [Actinomycetota bacterium]|nr:hypothetical protein [Actinomycetota bacterium]